MKDCEKRVGRLDRWTEDKSRCIKEGQCIDMRFKPACFRENTWSGNVSGNQGHLPHLHIQWDVVRGKENSSPLRGFDGKAQGRAKFPLKQEGEGNSHSGH